MSKKWQTINIEKHTLECIIKSAKYFGCSYSELLGLLLEMANLHNEFTTIAGQPAKASFLRHAKTQSNPELRKILEDYSWHFPKSKRQPAETE